MKPGLHHLMDKNDNLYFQSRYAGNSQFDGKPALQSFLQPFDTAFAWADLAQIRLIPNSAMALPN